MSFPGGITVLEIGLAPTGTEAAQGVSITTTGNKLIYAPSRPVALMRWGFIVTTAIASAFPTLTLDWHPTAGSATSAVTGATTQLQGQTGWNASALPAFYTDLAGGSMTLSAAMAAGKGAFHQINPQTKMPPNDASTNPVPSPDTAFVPGGGEQSLGLTVYPGQEIAFNVSVAAGAGVVIPFFHVIPLGFQGAGSNYENVASGIPGSIQPIVGDPGIWTRFLS